jgi:hypothetical protein
MQPSSCGKRSANAECKRTSEAINESTENSDANRAANPDADQDHAGQDFRQLRGQHRRQPDGGDCERAQSTGGVTVWLQVRVLPGPPIRSITYREGHFGRTSCPTDSTG